MEQNAGPVAAGRPVAVLDANVLVPPALRDVLLSCARAGVYRPVWQDEILDEIHRNSIRLGMDRRGLSENQARLGADHALSQMRTGFPHACLESRLWTPLVARMTCHETDRHVLAAAVGAGATHVVTANVRDFPARSRPVGVTVTSADSFLQDQLIRRPDLVIEAVEAMSRRLKNPPRSPAAIAARFADGRSAPQFGRGLGKLLSGWR